MGGHSELEFKGICLIDQPLVVIGNILSDTAFYPKCFFNCSESKRIPMDNTPGPGYFLYIAIDTPWPFKDRDVVYKANVGIGHDLGRVTIKSIVLTEPIVPLRSAYVRITDPQHRWILEKVTSEKTRVTFTTRTNAAGPFASYISNPSTRGTTFYSFKNLKTWTRASNNGNDGEKWVTCCCKSEV